MRIVSRVDWGARYPDGSGPAPLPAELLLLHHSVTHGVGPPAVRTLERIGHNRFGSGISYTFVVDQAGGIYQGHSINRRGTHTRGLNSKARAICGVGNFENDKPSSQLISSMGWLVRHGHSHGWWPAQLTGGHRDAPGAATACPGRNLYSEIPAINTLAGIPLEEDELVQDIIGFHEAYYGVTPGSEKWTKAVVKSVDYHLGRVLRGEKTLEDVRKEFSATIGL